MPEDEEAPVNLDQYFIRGSSAFKNHSQAETADNENERTTAVDKVFTRNCRLLNYESKTPIKGDVQQICAPSDKLTVTLDSEQQTKHGITMWLNKKTDKKEVPVTTSSV
jgi:hypothetical protein